MKKYFLVSFFLLLAGTITAQHRWMLGAYAGPTYTTLRGPGINKNEESPCYRFTAGLSATRNLSEHFAVQTGLAYEDIGAKGKFNEYYYDHFNKTWHFVLQRDIRDHFHYLTVPVSARLQYGRKVKFSVSGGLFASWLLAKKSVLEAGHKNYYNDQTRFYRHMNAGISGGLGINIPLKEKWLFTIEARDRLGLVNIADTKNFSWNRETKTNNLMLLVGFGYKGPLARQNSKHRWVLGFAAGLAYPDLRRESVDGWEELPSWRFTGELSATRKVSEHVVIKTGLAYEDIGARGKIQFYNDMEEYLGEKTIRNHFYYLTLPLSARLHYGRKVQGFVSGGIFVSHLVSKTTAYEKPGEERVVTDQTGFYKPFNAGLTCGLGINIPAGDQWLIILEARNNYGLTNIWDPGNAYWYHEPVRTNNAAVLLGIGYKL